MRTMFLALLLAAPRLFSADAPHCKLEGGTISTNFLDQTSTQGVATGSLAGGVGVDVKDVSPGNSPGALVFHNHHRWVTATGDTITFSDADATAYPVIELPGFFAVAYKSGLTITGGTGRFDGASGTLDAYGAVNNNAGQIVLRYTGRVCYPPNQ